MGRPTSKPRITRVWTYDTEPDRIHYAITTGNGSVRHLYVARDSALGQILEEYL